MKKIKTLLFTAMMMLSVTVSSLFGFADTIANVNTSDSNSHFFFYIALGIIAVAVIAFIIIVIVKHNIDKKDK